MSKQDEAGLILKLYELRREETMRKARDWYFAQFHPGSVNEYSAAVFGPSGGFVRMVISYWDMAAALVNQGAISMEMFNETNGEHIGVFAKVEPFLAEIRAQWSPHYMENLEKLIDATPNGRERTAKQRERSKEMLRRRNT